MPCIVRIKFEYSYSIVRSDCLRDGFRISMLRDGEMIKWRFFDSLKNFSSAQAFCTERSATLWSVRSEIEWEDIMADSEVIISGKSFWIDGMPYYDNSTYEESMNGGGIPFSVWEEGDKKKKFFFYSRLFIGDWAEKNCIAVDSSCDRLWSMAHCELELHNIFCIKRNCFD